VRWSVIDSRLGLLCYRTVLQGAHM
jgi:hypothetical protein